MDARQYIPIKKDGSLISPIAATDEIGAVAFVLDETTEPTPIADKGHLYTKSDNLLYFQDGAGIEHPVNINNTPYGEAFISENATPTVIETASTPIALREIVTGLVNNWTFDAGATAAITAFADAGGGQVTVTSSNSLSNGDVITIRGTTNYNGIQTVSNASGAAFEITDAWVADDGASDWDRGASLTAGAGAAGKYSAMWQMSSFCAGAQIVTFAMNINATPQLKTFAQRKFPVTDLGSASSTAILDISDGDVIWLSASSTGTSNLTNEHGNFNMRRV